MYAQTNLSPSPRHSVRNGLMATCIALSALGFALPAHAGAVSFAPPVPANTGTQDGREPSCSFTSSLPETWGQLSGALNSAIKEGRVKSDDFMTICGMKADGRHGRLISVWGLSGPDGISPTISLQKYLPR
jgi:hypothetical protein